VRPFAFILNDRFKSSAPRIPAARLERVQSFRRRLDDCVEELFDRACSTNNLLAATDLLALLEKWHARRSDSYGRERRTSDAALQRARGRLERLRALHGFRVAGIEAHTVRQREQAADVEAACHQLQKVIQRLTGEIEIISRARQAELARTKELETVLQFPLVRKTLLRALHPDSHPGMTDEERRALTAQFQKASVELKELKPR
jgi:hypothetical protein